MSFIFGGNTGASYEDIQRRRAVAQQLMAQRTAPRNVGEGLHAIGQALLGRAMERKASRQEDKLRADFDQQFGQVAPQGQAMLDLYNNPMASDGHKKVLGALMAKGVPGFSRGGVTQKRGPIIVGEAGPEIIEAPEGTEIEPVDDPLMDREMEFLKESRFDDGSAHQVADLDAFKLMQIEPEYEAPVDNDANSTEARRLQLLRRAMFADAALEDPRLARAMTRMDNAVAGKLGALGRLYTNDEYELGRLMAEQFASAILRGDSGAQTPEPEVQRYIRQYFPLPAETPEQIAAKKAMRREEIRAMIQSLPTDARPAAEQIQQEIDQLRAQADVPDGFFDKETPAPEPPKSAGEDGWQTINGVKIRVKK